MLRVGCRVLGVGCLGVVRSSLFVVRYLLCVVCCLLFDSCNVLSVVGCSLGWLVALWFVCCLTYGVVCCALCVLC